MLTGLEEKHIYCPYCGEPITVLVDMSVPSQEYVEDCSVCCRPIEIQVLVEDGNCWIEARSDSD